MTEQPTDLTKLTKDHAPPFAYDQAKEALEKATTTDEVKGILNEASMIQAYARQAKDRTMELNAAIVRHTAERRLGQMLETHAMQQGHKGTAKKSNGAEPLISELGIEERAKPPILEELGITKKLSVIAKDMAAMTEHQFNEALNHLRAHVLKEGADTPAFSVYRLAEGHRRNRTAPKRETAPGNYGEDRFTIITSDPPWAHGASSIPYPTLTDSELIHAYKPPHEPNATLLLWSIQSTIPRAIEIIKGWGATYRDIIIWQKRNEDTGTDGGVSRWNLPNYNAEVCLIATWGTNPPTIDGMPRWIEAPVERREHSTKPSLFYELLRESTPDTKRLDQFARKQHAGFHAWGNEIPNGYQRWDGEPPTNPDLF